VQNAAFIQMSLLNRTENQMVDRFNLILARLKDSSKDVRTTAATVLRTWAIRVGSESLGNWAARFGREALDVLLEHENDVEAREALTMAKVFCDLKV
jgi:hypothetical protein